MTASEAVLDVAGLQALLDVLSSRGYTPVGPTVRDGAVVLSTIRSVDDLPRGVHDRQAPGRYRLEDSAGERFFAFAATATSWKAHLFPARRPLWRVGDDGGAEPAAVDETPRALIGVRSCDLHAIAVQDAVLGGRPYADPDYASRREHTFVVAVTCARPGDTCFCVSMGTGPRPDSGYDLALTELLDDEGHRFLAEAGSASGADVLAALPAQAPRAADRDGAAAVASHAAAAMGRSLDTDGLRDLLYAGQEHPRWDEVAQRCLSCANCTLVCPTCFCVTTREVVDLTGPVGRDREWDSCFGPDHSYLHGGPVRSTTAARYRQWLTHKFASWIDQFGTSGCVGCGRCITWCPAAIDVTEELAAIRSTAPAEGGST